MRSWKNASSTFPVCKEEVREREKEREREREKFVTEARKQRYVGKLGEDVSHVSRGRQAECWLSDVWCEDEVTPSRTTRRQFIELSRPKAYRLSCSRPLVFHRPSNICDNRRCLPTRYMVSVVPARGLNFYFSFEWARWWKSAREWFMEGSQY